MNDEKQRTEQLREAGYCLECEGWGWYRIGESENAIEVECADCGGTGEAAVQSNVADGTGGAA